MNITLNVTIPKNTRFETQGELIEGYIKLAEDIKKEHSVNCTLSMNFEIKD